MAKAPITKSGDTESGAAKAGQAKPDDSDNRLIQIEFPTKITWFVGLAMGMGALLVIWSVVIHRLFFAPIGQANLAFAAGIAIILAAFGGQATVRGKAIVFAGVAAIALGLLLYLDHYSDSGRRLLVEGRVEKLPVDQFKASLKFGQTVYSKQPLDDKQFEFVAFKEDVETTQHATLEIADQNSGEVVASFSIPVRCFQPWVGTSRLIDWSYDVQDNVLKESATNNVIATFGEPADTEKKAKPCSQSVEGAALVTEPAVELAAMGFLVSPALAGEMGPPSPAQIDEALKLLEHDNADVRRAARDLLSQVQPQDVRRLLDYAAQHRDTYRVELGVSVALTGMLRRDKSLGKAIVLTQPDIDMLLDFTTAKDRTLRIYAGEFLFDLGSKEVAKTALTRAAQMPPDATLDDARFNLVFVSQDGWRAMSAAEQAALAEVILTLRASLAGKPKTLALLDSFAQL